MADPDVPEPLALLPTPAPNGSNPPAPEAAPPPAQEAAPPPAQGAAPPPAQGAVPSSVRRAWRAGWTVLHGGLGLLAGLSLLASIPVLQFAVLGWMLEVEGRLARGEGWRRGLLPGLTAAVPFGSGLIGCGALLLPFLVLWHLRADAQLLAPGSAHAVGWGRAAAVYGALAGLHAALALLAGRGSLLAFATPFENLKVLYRRRRRGEPALPRPAQAQAWARGLRLGHYLALGVKGFLAAAAWLTPPSLLLALAVGQQAPLLGLLAALALVLCLRSALVAQGRVAAEGRLRAAFEWGAIRQGIARAPLATALALVLTLGLALPLYLFKVEPPPRDALWLPALVFLVTLWPARVVAGWALGRSRREGRAAWPWRLIGTAVALPAGGAYVFFVFFNQFFAWRGAAHLLAHHAFLVPVPFY